MTTYEIGSENYQPRSPGINYRRNLTENSIDDNYKDKKISELRNKIYDLKQREKDFDSLNQRYKQLLTDFQVLNEAKLRLEYEIRQRESEYNRRITDLKAEKETLQLGLNDKMTSSKKIFSENDILERQIGLKDGEINDLNKRLNDLSSQYDHTEQNRNELTKIINNLHDNNINQDDQIFKLKQDNICLSKMCEDNERNIRLGNNEINKLSKTIDENIYEIQKLNGKVVHQEKNQNELQRKLDACNNKNLKLQNTMKNYEREFDKFRDENDGLKNDLLNERNLRSEKENQNEKLKCILMEKERELSQLCNENDNMQMMNKDDTEKNNSYKIENDKLTNQIRILESQNQDIINEIDNILEEDRKMKEILTRKSRITSLLRDNNDTLERSINNLDTYISRSYNNYDNSKYMPSSTRFTYQFGERSYV
jgi:chromosome segregation ATPase